MSQQYPAINAPKVVQPKETPTFILKDYYGARTFMKAAPHVKAKITRTSDGYYYGSVDERKNRLKGVEIYKYNEISHQYELIFEGGSPLAEAWERRIIEDLKEMYKHIDW